MKKVLRKILVIILIVIAIVSVSYTVIKDTEIKKQEEERKKQAMGNVSVENIQDDEKKEEQNKVNEQKEDKKETEKDDKKVEIKSESENVQILTEPKDYSDYESNIEELIKEEENKNVLDDLKSGDNNLIYKNADGSYYEYCFENDKITNIYYYVECGNKSVAQYMLQAYTTEQMKDIYAEAEIYKERAIKAKMSKKMVDTYSNFNKEKLMNSMDEANNELKR